MAEAAADAIGADGLLARVDQTFMILEDQTSILLVENQVEWKIHIIKYHHLYQPDYYCPCQRWFELAKQYNLPDEITNLSLNIMVLI